MNQQSATAKQKSLGDVLQEFSQHRKVMQNELQKVIVGQTEVIEQLFAAIFTRGHCLLEGVPGLAKTLMVSTLARILDIQFQRIQFTPDLMPSDITGTNVLEEDDAGRRNFRFVEGPIFTNILFRFFLHINIPNVKYTCSFFYFRFHYPVNEIPTASEYSFFCYCFIHVLHPLVF